MPHAAGTVAYALDYHRHRGRYPDGRLMPTPMLEAQGLRIDWDRPDLPLPGPVEELSPCPPTNPTAYHQRCSTVPDRPEALAGARDRYGTVLTLTIGGWGSSATDYFTVPRRK
ncbi:hypothetical protein AB0467_12215 [Streptomyces sp. NPDC052095]|uniref:hypothetical protein n=1 Tax=unclassified Streptomyces TaxID=2593676 RepID=UPI00344F505D